MKRLKKILKIIGRVILLLIGVVLVVFIIGVNLPLDTYSQKKEAVPDFVLVNCRIADFMQDTVVGQAYIEVKNGRIVRIGNMQDSLLPVNKVTIDAKGSFVLPGLWDMHVHTLSLSPQLHFPLLIANGVTGVRDMGDGESWISDIDTHEKKDADKWKLQMQKENLLVPRIQESCSFHVEGLDDIEGASLKTKANYLVTKLKGRGEPFIKLQMEGDEFSPEAFMQVLEEAKRLQMPVLGHLPETADIQTTLKTGFKSVEHAWAFIPHFSSIKSTDEHELIRQECYLRNQSAQIEDTVLSLMAENNVWYVPTHVTSNKKEAFAFDTAFVNRAENKYIEGTQLWIWETWAGLHTSGVETEAQKATLMKYYKRGLEITGEAHRKGVKILAGTDALDRYVYHGFSLHDELEELVKAGLTPAEAIQTATINPASYFGITKDYGTIETGKVADFILVSENPLTKVGNTRKINAVYYNQRYYQQAELNAMKAYSENQANSFGVTCKFIWNMLKGLF
ncbi:MAG: amidohydrolase family protein [Bacteroidetes bacterium]|nr:amidohydrolase family protein [Bacteroidota bacterium]